jgi:membrane-associated HD superfamily phosphohydrolase
LELANRLIREKADDGQFDECLLTFEELAIVKTHLISALVAFQHTRVKYPRRESQVPEAEREATA